MKVIGVTKILMILAIAIGMTACGGGQGSYASDESDTFADDALADGGRNRPVSKTDGGRNTPIVKTVPVPTGPVLVPTTPIGLVGE